MRRSLFCATGFAGVRRMIRTTLLAAIALAAVTAPLHAQTEWTPIEPLPLGSVLLSLPSPHVAAAGTTEVRFNHRFGEVDSEGTLFGLDAGASVGMGIGWVPVRDLQLMLVRTNVLDTIELSAKYVVMQQAPAIPLSLTLRAGADWRTESGVDDESSVFVQGIIGRRFGSRFEVFVLPTWVTNAGRHATEQGSVATFRDAANVPIGAALLVGHGLSLVAEVIPPNEDLPGDDTGFGWAFGVKKAIGGHHFEIVVTNNPGTTVDQYVSSSFLGSPLDEGDVHLGFNIERQFGRSR